MATRHLLGWCNFLGLIVLLTGFCGVCCAQSNHATSVEVDLDLRSRLTSGLTSRAALYMGGLQLQSNLAPDLRLEVYGAHMTSALTTFPTAGNFLAQQATLEKRWNTQRLQAGIVRLPFGIYDNRETYASGLIDYPLPRLDWAWGSVNWGVQGAKFSGGNANFQVEAAAFGGAGAGVWNNRNDVGGGALRLQTFAPNLIVGISRWDGYIDNNGHQGVHINGVDLRYTRPHLLLRGEYMAGTMGGQTYHGGYFDLYYHLPRFNKFTVVGRLEMLHPVDNAPTGYQQTLGLRYMASPSWVLAVNWRHNNGATAYKGSWTPISSHTGDLYLQVYHKIKL